MTANDLLAVSVASFWLLFAALIKVGNWVGGKRWSDGPSLIPVIPVIPIGALAIGFAGNYVASPWGTWLIVGLYSALLIGATIRACIPVAASSGQR